MIETSNNLSPSTPNDREQRVVRSALWAAAGDALGWITELSHGAIGVKRRTGSSRVARTVSWQRIVGGRGGPKVHLPAGTYSDDTQLRLAVSRSIRGDGTFDAETFAKIELTVWPTYALGAGLGTKAAALGMSRRSAASFSNFFDAGGQRYVNGGGNGAAMRVQPHAWACKGSSPELALDVLRDALVTHGHPQGFCGAVFHAMVLENTLSCSALPTPDAWDAFIDTFLEIPSILERNPQLAAFWRVAWEDASGTTLEEAIKAMHADARRDLLQALAASPTMAPQDYRVVLEALGCVSNEFRGAGLKTALAALILAYMHRDAKPEDALVLAANELDSDTDTIATMAGALLGAIASDEPTWPLQDRAYIESEAKRLASIAHGQVESSFVYPDLARWTPPPNQMAAIGLVDDKLAIAGLGMLQAEGPEYVVGDAIWQWCRLPFGQTVLAKRKAGFLGGVPHEYLPGPARVLPASGAKPNGASAYGQQILGLSGSAPTQPESMPPPTHSAEIPRDESLDAVTDRVIKADFDDATLGRMLNYCIDRGESIEEAIAFVAIVAKAKIARRRRRR